MKLLNLITHALVRPSRIEINDYTTHSAIIRQSKKRLGSPNSCSHMHFNLWNLAHATIKADLVTNTNISLLRRFAFLIDTTEFIASNTSNFKLRKQPIDNLSDFVRTGYTGRIAQGLAVLLMEDMNYTYISKPPISCAQKCADFLFQQNGRYALVESKGTYSARPHLKSMLRDALDQINRTIPLLPANTIFKSFAMASIFGDDNNSRQTSLNIIDPERKGDSENGLEEDYIWRSNYSSWLSGMGHAKLAAKISPTAAYSDGEEQIEVNAAEYKGKTYIIDSFSHIKNLINGEYSEYELYYLIPFPMVMGLEMQILVETIENIKKGNKTNPKIGVREGRIDDILDGAPVSVFSDGTIYGHIASFGKIKKTIINI